MVKLVVAVAACIVLSAPAAAQAPAPESAVPTFGGCNAPRTFCWSPTTTLSLVGYSLKTGNFATGILPGVGYGFTVWPDRGYALGLGGYAQLQTGGGSSTTGLFSVIASFANYLRFGLGVQVLDTQHDKILLLGLGTDLK